jgi:hypothetical protein
MSVYIYFKDAIKGLDGFNEALHNGMPLSGIKFFLEKGRIIVQSKELIETIPEEFQKFVEEISFLGVLNMKAPRELGIYSLGNSEAELNYLNSDKKEIYRYRIKMTGKDMEGLLSLFREIKAGKISATDSHEGKQGGTRQELEKILEDAKTQIGRQESEIEKYKNILEEISKILVWGKFLVLTQKIKDLIKSIK